MQNLSSVKTLLLNASYEPMKIVSWQKALILWFQDKVEILEYHSAIVRSVTRSFNVPSVLRLKRYVQSQYFGRVRFCRENVFIRDNYTCQYCGIKLPASKLTLDHVVPASHHGEKSWTNIVTACQCCNQKKANRTPNSAKMPLKKEPKTPTWLPTLDYVDLTSAAIPTQWSQYLLLKTG